MAMPTALARYHRQKARASRPRTRTIQVVRTRTLRRAARRTRRRSRGAGGSGVNPLHLAFATAGLAYVTTHVDAVKGVASKIPGAATFGVPAAVGVACLLTDRFVKRNKWLRLMGMAGVVLAASRVGEKGSDFEWLGDADDYREVGADDYGEVGDYEVGDYDDGE